MIRLNKFISDSGYASRRDADRLIESGSVSVNGLVISALGTMISESDIVKINNKIITPRKSTTVILFHKPVNTLTSTSDPNGRKTIYDVLPQKYKSLKYIGRLDFKTTGLLMMTDDGELARKLTLPSSGLKRVYIATLHPLNFTEIKSSSRAKALRGFLSPLNSDDTIFDALRHGATIDGIKYEPMEIQVLSRYPLNVQLILTEGKKNEIRIALDYLGFMVKKLHRISYGNFNLGNLEPGHIRVLSDDEIKKLYNLKLHN